MSEKDLEEKIKIYNFEALKGSIDTHPVFRGAVKTFKKLASSAPKTFNALNETYQEQEGDKREDLGILSMTPEQLLDSIIQDINKLPREKRKKYLDDLASIKERKRAIEEALLAMVQMRVTTTLAPPGEAKALVQSGQISAKDVYDATAEVKASQKTVADRLSTGWEALAKGMQNLEPKRTLQ